MSLSGRRSPDAAGVGGDEADGEGALGAGLVPRHAVHLVHDLALEDLPEVQNLDAHPAVEGAGLDDDERSALLLYNMAHVPGWRRTARFRAVLALAAPPDGDILKTTSGSVEGAICHEPVGKGGFGYDPVFWLPEKAMTMAQLTREEKNALSHRSKAAMAMARFLETFA